jgi:DNA-binding MarR family transcriptional regulator
MSSLDHDFVPCRACACSALRRASRAVTLHYEAHFRGLDLHATQFTILATLIQTGPIALTRLADQLGVDRTTLTRNLRPLARKGFVTEAPQADRRVKQVMITQAGAAAARAALPAWQKAQDSVGPVLERVGLIPARLTGGA